MIAEQAALARHIDTCRHEWLTWRPRLREFAALSPRFGGYVPVPPGYTRVYCVACNITNDIKGE